MFYVPIQNCNFVKTKNNYKPKKPLQDFQCLYNIQLFTSVLMNVMKLFSLISLDSNWLPLEFLNLSQETWKHLF